MHAHVVVERKGFYHTCNSRECMGVNGEALQLHAVYKKPYFYYKSHENPYQVLQVLLAFSKYISQLQNLDYQYENPYQVLQVLHAASERAMKRAMKSMVVPSYTGKYHSFVAVGIVTRAVHS